MIQNEIDTYPVWRTKPLRLIAVDAEYIVCILWHRKAPKVCSE